MTAMNDIFSFKRFGRTLRHDIIGTANRAGLSMLLTPAIVLLAVALVMQLYDLIFMYRFGEEIPVYPVARFVILCITHIILMLFMATSSFGHLTDRRNNITQLMLPASTLEKFLSITIIYYIFTPIVIFLAGWAGDTLIALTGLGGFTGYMNPADMAHSIDKFYGEILVPGMAPVLNHALWSWLAGYFMAAAFVLLCAILFKSYKVLKTIAVYLGLSLVLGNLQTIFFGKKVLFLMEGIETQSAEQAEYIPMQIFDTADKLLQYGLIFSIVAFIALSIAIYYRLRTVKS